MRTETISRNLFQFDELNDDAKQKAIDWFRNASSNDFNEFHTWTQKVIWLMI